MENQIASKVKQQKKSLPYKKRPCSDCPFRKDSLKGWLGEKRMTEILNAKSFTCHKTGDKSKPLLQCAGHMIISGEHNDFVRLMSRMNVTSELAGKSLVFETKRECINHHKK